MSANKLIRLDIHSSQRNQLIDITEKVQKIVADSRISDGVAHIFVPHTTAAVTINENADPTVQTDIMGFLAKLIPHDASFRHSEGNSDAHIKASLVGTHAVVFIEGSQMVLGTWQGIYFCEFDGPRARQVIVKIVIDK